MSLAVNYRDYWKLSRWPFGDCVPPSTYLELPGQVEADARLKVVIERLYPLSVVVGPDGCGKTTFLKRNFQPQLLIKRKQLARPIYTSMAGMGRGDLFTAIAASTYERSGISSGLTAERQVRDVLKSNSLQGLSSLIFLDDIHLADSETALDVFRLLDTNQDIALVLCATEIPPSPFQDLIHSRAQLRIDLQPWTLTDVEQFIQKSIANAGGNPLLFSDQSIVRLHELSEGLARRLIQLLEITLLAGAANNAEGITPELVDTAAEEIAIPQAEDQWSV
jgi:replication-associated recombination protein RarA